LAGEKKGEDMSRLKFRYWDKEIKQMRTGDIGLDAEGKLFVVNACVADEPITHIDNVIPMQCTGVKDKNGNLIFESDILKEMFDTGEGTKETDYTQVKWDDEAAGFVMFRPDCPRDLSYFDEIEDINNYEVVGNIYENKELAEELWGKHC
jgi:uncharacterized phage protein (TIGR01671 family)